MDLRRRPALQGFGAFLASLALARAGGGAGAAVAAEGGTLKFGPAEPFTFEGLVERARRMAREPYVSPPRPAPDVVQRIDYDAHGRLRFRPEYALYADGPGAYPVTFVFMGGFFPKSVQMHELRDGVAREVLYSPDYFTIPEDSVARQLPPDASAFAGLWLRESRLSGDWKAKEPWATFLGGCYFRAVGELGQVGMSARGIALDVAGPNPEEFPDFVAHWIEEGAAEGEPVTVCSLLDGPSLAGAYRFRIARGSGVVMDIENHLFMRRDVERLGVAPLTSMFWYGEYGRERMADWRPEVHDADTLVLWNGANERIVRPLNNPTRIFHTSYSDNNPRGFGLSQRDRNFDHYLDGVGYDRRPSVWVEPIGDWGRGVVQLVEIPTDDEIYDNIAAYWLPEKPTRAGDELSFRYRLHWLKDEPHFPANLAKVVATRMGRGGQPGQPRPRGLLKFTIEFLGGELANLPYGQRPEPNIWASRGQISLVQTDPVPNDVPGHWRTHFDLAVDGREPVEMRMFLRLGDKTLTETWLYLLEPPVTV